LLKRGGAKEKQYINENFQGWVVTKGNTGSIFALLDSIGKGLGHLRMLSLELLAPAHQTVRKAHLF